MSGRRSTAAPTHQNDAINFNSAFTDSWVPSLVVSFHLRRDVDELPRGDNETFDATATPVVIIRGLNLDRKLPNDTLNIFYVPS
jgi:hypothetical protein